MKKKLQLAAQLYTLRDFIQNITDFRKTLRKVKAMGYDSFQYSGAGPLDPAVVRDVMNEVGIPMSATHVNPYHLKDSLPRLISEHRLLDCSFVGIGMMPEEYRGSYEGILRFAREFNEVGKALRSEGMTLIYHNHSFEFGKRNGKRILDILLEETDPGCFDIELDTYWVQAGGGDPIQWIHRVDGRMRYIHLKDMGVEGFTPFTAPVGEGNLNWEGILKACMNTGVEICAVEQDQCQGSPFDCLQTSYDNLALWLGRREKTI